MAYSFNPFFPSKTSPAPITSTPNTTTNSGNNFSDLAQSLGISTHNEKISTPSTNTPGGTPGVYSTTPSESNTYGLSLTPPQVSKSTSVVSSSNAIDQSNQAQSAITDYKTNQSQKTLTNQQNTAMDSSTPNTSPTLAGSGNPNPAYTPPPSNTPTPPQSTGQPGQTQYYNQATGEQEWVNTPTDGTVPPGYSAQNPKTRTDVTSTVNAPGGVTYKQFSDGTYGRFDLTTGTYSQGNATDYAIASAAQSAASKLQDVQNGVLTPTQQAAISNLMSMQASSMSKLITSNNMKTGGMNAFQAEFGQGVASGPGAITQIINDGATAVAQLQVSQAAAVEAMTKGFQQDNIDLLNQSFSQYKDSQAAIETQINSMQNAALAVEKNQSDKEYSFAVGEMGKYPRAGIMPTDSPDMVAAKEASDPDWQAQNAIKTGAVDQNAVDAMVKYYTLNGTPPIISGMNAQPIRNAFWAAVAKAPGTVNQATSNKMAIAAAQKALNNQTELYAATQSANVAFKGAIQIAYDTLAPTFKTTSPFLNKPVQWVQDQIQGNPDLSSEKLALTSVASEYAKIMNGASASIAGVPVSSQQEILSQLYAAMSNGQIESVMDTMAKDVNQREISYQSSINSIKNDVSALQATPITENNTTTGNNSTTGFAGGGAF